MIELRPVAVDRPAEVAVALVEAVLEVGCPRSLRVPGIEAAALLDVTFARQDLRQDVALLQRWNDGVDEGFANMVAWEEFRLEDRDRELGLASEARGERCAGRSTSHDGNVVHLISII